MLILAKSASQRSGVSTGKSEPNSILWRKRLLAYWIRLAGKYLGDHPERSMYTVGLWVATESASSCQGNEGCAAMIGMSGKSTATSSRYMGLEYLRRMPPPPGMLAPAPVWPVWNRAG